MLVTAWDRMEIFAFYPLVFCLYYEALWPQVPPLITCSEFYMKKKNQSDIQTSDPRPPCQSANPSQESRGVNCICLMVHRPHSQEPRKRCGLSTPIYPSIFSSQLSMKCWPALLSQCEHSVLWTLTMSTMLFINKAHTLFTCINDVALIFLHGDRDFV